MSTQTVSSVSRELDVQIYTAFHQIWLAELGPKTVKIHDGSILPTLSFQLYEVVNLTHSGSAGRAPLKIYSLTISQNHQMTLFFGISDLAIRARARNQKLARIVKGNKNEKVVPTCCGRFSQCETTQRGRIGRDMT